MLTKPWMICIGVQSLLLLVCLACISLLLWRGHVLQTEQSRLKTELLATQSTLADQQARFEQYRQQTEAMQQQLAAAAEQQASTQTELQDALSHEPNQTWGNTRLPDSIGGLLNR